MEYLQCCAADFLPQPPKLCVVFQFVQCFPITGEISPARSAWSARTRATTASTIGTARGRTQGSCLPDTISSSSFIVSRFTVFCVFGIDDGGLNAILLMIGIPNDNPPSMPPAFFVLETILPPTTVYWSLFCEPLNRAALNPEPNSTPLTAGIENSALAKSESRESKTGSPRPRGAFFATHSINPPTLSPFFFSSSISSFIFSAASESGHLT